VFHQIRYPIEVKAPHSYKTEASDMRTACGSLFVKPHIEPEPFHTGQPHHLRSDWKPSIRWCNACTMRRCQVCYVSGIICQVYTHRKHATNN